MIFGECGESVDGRADGLCVLSGVVGVEVGQRCVEVRSGDGREWIGGGDSTHDFERRCREGVVDGGVVGPADARAIGRPVAYLHVGE